MNPRLKDIFARRSIRRYTPDRIPDSAVHDMLEAAMAAPSAVCRDPWDIIVIRDKTMLRTVSEGLPNGKMLADAAVGFVICGDPDRAHDNQMSYLLQDCSALVENLLLAASTLGFGACWLGVHPREERQKYLRSILGIPASIIPVAAVAVGVPAENKAPRTRYNPDRVHSDKWQPHA